MEAKEFIMIYSEPTPNPETMKFVANRMILPDNSADFQTRESALRSPLATKLFEMPFVNGVFIMNNFITVSKISNVEWDNIIPSLKEFLKTYLESEATIIHKQEEVMDDANDTEAIKKIKLALEQHVKPAVEMDGGMISYKSFENGIVTVTMQGSCSGCPSSTMTLKAGIENLLKRLVPEVESVEAEAL